MAQIGRPYPFQLNRDLFDNTLGYWGAPLRLRTWTPTAPSIFGGVCGQGWFGPIISDEGILIAPGRVRYVFPTPATADPRSGCYLDMTLVATATLFKNDLDMRTTFDGFTSPKGGGVWVGPTVPSRELHVNGVWASWVVPGHGTFNSNLQQTDNANYTECGL